MAFAHGRQRALLGRVAASFAHLAAPRARQLVHQVVQLIRVVGEAPADAAKLTTAARQAAPGDAGAPGGAFPRQRSHRPSVGDVLPANRSTGARPAVARVLGQAGGVFSQPVGSRGREHAGGCAKSSKSRSCARSGGLSGADPVHLRERGGLWTLWTSFTCGNDVRTGSATGNPVDPIREQGAARTDWRGQTGAEPATLTAARRAPGARSPGSRAIRPPGSSRSHSCGRGTARRSRGARRPRRSTGCPCRRRACEDRSG